MKRLTLLITILITIVMTLTCSDAQIASNNLRIDAEMFRLQRRIVFFNGITDTYLLAIEGRCSIEDQRNQLEVTCKTGKDEYKKHHLGLSDNVSYFSEQLESVPVDVYHYKIIFKPRSIVPNMEVVN